VLGSGREVQRRYVLRDPADELPFDCAHGGVKLREFGRERSHPVCSDDRLD
jgi:hypothetical protein